MPSRSVDRRRTAVVCLAVLVCLAATGCDETSPGSFETNLRVSRLEFDAARVPGGTVEVDTAGQTLTVTLSGLPELGGLYVYEGWVIADPTGTPTAVSAGRYTAATSGSPFPTAQGAITYAVDGTTSATGALQQVGDGQPYVADSLTANPRFVLSIEPNPDNDPAPYSIKLVAGVLTLGETQPLALAGHSGFNLADLSGEVTINTVTGEFELDLSRLGRFDRSMPGAAGDPGLIYQAWLVDTDPDPDRILSVRRFNANLVGDAPIAGQLNPGDTDGDGQPEPLDVERVYISIEPDGVANFEPVGSGIDTSPNIFSAVPYVADLPILTER